MSFFNTKSSFRSVIFLSGGTAFSQAFPLAMMPILTRLYTPEDFGLAALFLAISSLLIPLSTARYEIAIMLAETDLEVHEIASLSLLVLIAFALLLICIITLFGGFIAEVLNNKEILPWLYALPLYVILCGINNIAKYLNNQKGIYKRIAYSSIILSSMNSSTQTLFGVFSKWSGGLIIGRYFSMMFSSIFLLIPWLKEKRYSRPSSKKLAEIAKKYKQYPTHSLAGAVFNSASKNMLNFYLSAVYSSTTLGFYYLAHKVLGYPSSMVGGAISRVFFKDSVSEKKSTGAAAVVFKKYLIAVLFFSVLVYLPLFFLVEDIFKFIFGDSWRVAGSYAKILIPLFAARFIVSSVSSIDSTMMRQSAYMVFNLIMFVVNVGIFLLFFRSEIELLLGVISGVNSALYLFYLLYLWLLSKNAV